MALAKILVIIPHASRKRPAEIKKSWLSKNQRHLLYSGSSETDRDSEKLYDLKKIIGNEQIIFPVSQVYINVCRHPDDIDQICPTNIRGTEIYNRKISDKLRKKLVKKYAIPFYNKMKKFDGDVIFSGHITIANHSSLDKKLNYQIILSDLMKRGKKIITFAPPRMIEIYAEEIKKRLPNVKIGINSVYVGVYDYICDRFGWRKNGKGIPIIHQETDEGLFIKNNKPNYKKIERLKKIFAESLKETIKRYNSKKI